MSTLWPDSDAYKTVSGEGKGWLTVGRVAVLVTLFENPYLVMNNMAVNGC